MKVIFDISKIGEGYRQSRAGTALFRAVENVAYGLVSSPECEVSFCATESFQALSGCLDYLEHESRFNGARFLSPRLAKLGKVLDGRLQNASAEVEGTPFLDLLKDPKYSWAFINGLRLQKRVERRLLAYACRAVEDSQLLDPRWLTRADIFHSPLCPLPQQVRDVQRFLTVYDIIPILYPQFCVPRQVQFTNEILHSIGPEDWVVCISQATKNDVCNHLSIDPTRVFVTPLAAAPELFYPCSDLEKIARARNKYRIPDGPYILSLNTLEPRKNVDHVIRCFARLVQEQNIQDLKLVLVGAKGWLYDKILEAISAYDSLGDRIIATGYVADEDLSALYSAALAFVFPSYYEGFGLPPLEAMQCGIPVITSNTSSLPEVVGDAAVMLDPEDADGLCHNVLQVYRSASLREAMSQKSLERAKEFSWRKCTQETVAAYKVALSA